MNLYRRFIEPALVECACSAGPIGKQRRKVVPRAEGVVLEIGFGAGQNLPFYDAAKVEKLYALEPSAGMRARAARRLRETPLLTELLDLRAETIPLDDASVDTVLTTYTLCTILDVAGALAQVRRVLKPSGRLLFCEHGQAPDKGVQKFQDRINGLWGAVGGGCNLNRRIPAMLRNAGFEFDDLAARYLPGTPRFAGYNYWGSARAISG